ncbi:hypothetical protein [Saccharothrix saharensis]|nr:hypothetical protein [Saccharothrix saharensis]
MAEVVRRHHPEAVVLVGIAVGHARPAADLPHGGCTTVGGVGRRVLADCA